MYVARADMKILCSDEVMDMRQEYEDRFGEDFIMFNYADFPGSETQLAAEMYRETLRKALADNKPYHIVSRRYEVFDH